MMRALFVMFAIGCAAEPLPTSSPCEEASTTLSRCTGSIPEGFADACAANPDEVASAVLAEADGESCDPNGKADGLAKAAFVDGCSALINAASWVIWARSPSAVPLSAKQKASLRPWFGNLVDTARISWNSNLLTRWRVFGRDIVFDEDTTAQTFGDSIYINQAAADDTSTLVLIGHELRHVSQYRKYGGTAGFARQYCTSFYDASYSYRNNPLEVEAFDGQYKIQRCLTSHQGCP
jgi:hypothetical protein